jgi:formate dehydrogenase subunit delta
LDIKTLIRMANQIGDFFAAFPDHDEALQGIAAHLQRFWEPRMRQALLAHVDAAGGEGLRPVVLAAIAKHRIDLESPSRDQPGQRVQQELPGGGSA